MGTQSATRSQMMVALRRWMPNASLRRIGDLLDQAKVMTMEGKSELSTSLAFGLVLEGTMRVTVEGGETRWIGPGEVFGIGRYQLNRADAPTLLTNTTKSARYLAFSHADIAPLTGARLPSGEK
jgi:hypothetical protein